MTVGEKMFQLFIILNKIKQVSCHFNDSFFFEFFLMKGFVPGLSPDRTYLWIMGTDSSEIHVRHFRAIGTLKIS